MTDDQVKALGAQYPGEYVSANVETGEMVSHGGRAEVYASASIPLKPGQQKRITIFKFNERGELDNGVI